MEKTYIGRRPQSIKTGISQWPLIGTFSNFKLKLMGPNQNLKLYDMKTTFHGRLLQNIKSGISQQPPIRSFSNFDLWGPYQTYNFKSGISQLPLIRSYLDLKFNLKKKNTSTFLKTMTFVSKGKFRGNPRGNLECGSAQPSLFSLFSINFLK